MSKNLTKYLFLYCVYSAIVLYYIRALTMAYFLKKSNYKKGTYLQIYESFYDPDRGYSAHKSYKAIGYVNDLIADGIEDPIAYYQSEVDDLNRKRKQGLSEAKYKQISEETPERFLGYFPLKAINDSLGAKKFVDLMQTATDYKFNVYELMSALIYSRATLPCSKSRTYDEVIPRLYTNYNLSLPQIYSGLAYIGSEYEKIIEIYNVQVQAKYGHDTKHTYFDCTNFYFEIDREDDFRKKGPSKERKLEPLVGMGLLLDANLIPMGMKIYPGNESEKPKLREVINSLKERNNIKGRTIQVADKGLNSAPNIIETLKQKDGYIFSKSVKMLAAIEKDWIFLPQDYVDVKDSNGNILYRYKECIDDFPYDLIDSKGKKKTVLLKEKRVVTYNPTLAKKQQYEIHKLIEKANDLTVSKAKKSEYGECSKYVSFQAADKRGKKKEEDVVIAEINQDKINEDLALAGYNLLVTSETNMSASELYSTYHDLWRIEESFRIMKSQLDARPVYLQKEDTITGHFLICYLCVLLLRLLQFKKLDNKYCSEDIFSFIKNFRVVEVSENKYINITRATDFIKDFARDTSLPLMSYYLSKGQISGMLSYRF